jgi:dinuclear metal center YbgI/SA1388 family protein
LATVGEVAAVCDRLWPPARAEAWDNVGLLLGTRGAPVRRCLCALDADAATVEAAVAAGAEMVVSHHPAFLQPLRRLTDDGPVGAALLQAARRGIALYAAHTNFDVAPGGVNAALAAALGLDATVPLRVSGREALYKLVVFVPAGYEERILAALAEAGAGRIGKYSHCSFGAPGVGTFRPLPGAQPFVGQVGSLERQDEIRLEVLVPEGRRRSAVEAMLRAHPYEEVAYDLYRLENEGPAWGLGLVGELPTALTLEAFAAEVARRLQAPATRFVGPPGRCIRRVAVCGGAGAGAAAGCVEAALRAGADVLVTADVRYHEAREAEARGLALVDPGHQATEAPAVPAMAEALRPALREAGLEVEVVVAPPRDDVWRSAGAAAGGRVP